MAINRIRELRIEAGLKQIDLANILGVRQNTLSTWETGRYEPDNEMLQRIADHFSVSVDYVLGKSAVKSFRVPDVSTVQVMQLLRAVEEMSPSQYASTYEYASNLLAGGGEKEKPATVSGDGQADKLAQALHGIGIEVDKLSDAEISRIARLAKAALKKFVLQLSNECSIIGSTHKIEKGRARA